MKTFLELICNILFVLRISYMFIHENGMYDIFDRIRVYVGINNINGQQIIDYKNKNIFLQGVLSCFYCFSMYPALFITIINLISNKIAKIISMPFAISMVSIILYEWFIKLNSE